MGVARGSTQWSCSRFQAAGDTYYVSVAAHPAAEGAAEGTVDLAVTDGGRAWVATGAPCGVLQGAAACPRPCDSGQPAAAHRYPHALVPNPAHSSYV